MVMDELTIGVAAIVVSALSYFAGVVRTKQQQASNDQDSRINKVLDKYVSASQAGRCNSYGGLVQAGIGLLKNDKEIRELLDRIVKHGESWDPRSQLAGIDTYQLFQKAKEKRLNFSYSGVAESLIAEMRQGTVTY
ncbi:MAG: hypothetical protein A2270_10455 [Elusimicrobia bacterium RIFOXYA12_FULL_51_18]|nr:MAG: hypothetical protein A2270_10455 [Elusimicrobia bacterium RIFOXYA12_FULL_51_18]OGS29515.1 MAG: hypothetical protein A2218_00735 [Elusimicrobia bacterium RIFOXYA2_FULL_53_38]